MEGTPPAEKTPPGLNGKPTPRPAFAGSAAVEAPTPAIVSASQHTSCRPLPPAGPPQHQGKREGQHGPGHQPQPADTGQGLPPQRRTPGPAGHLNTGSPAAVEAPTPAPAPAPARLRCGRIGRDLPRGRGQRCHLNRGRADRRHGPACPAGHLNAPADPAAIVSAAASQRHPWTPAAQGWPGSPAGHLNADRWRGTKKAPNPQKWCVIWCVKTLTC